MEKIRILWYFQIRERGGEREIEREVTMPPGILLLECDYENGKYFCVGMWSACGTYFCCEIKRWSFQNFIFINKIKKIVERKY